MKAAEELAAWEHWREACALALLSEEARLHLSQVIAERFRSMLRKINLHGQGHLTAPPDADCAHLFESYCALHERRDGKKYKHWLLTRGRRDLDTVQSGVMMLVRNVVREWIRDTQPKTAALSLQQCLGERGVTLQELLPDEAAEPRDLEQQAWLTARVRSELADLTALEATVLQIRAKGEVFSGPRIQETYGVGKSTLHKYHRRILTRIAEGAAERFSDLTPAAGAALVLDVMDGLGKIILCKLSAENPEVSAFGMVKDTHDAE